MQRYLTKARPYVGFGFILILVAMALVMSGCGNKGPLKPADEPVKTVHG
jgi:predicted small lipoprotein YifL